jgi:2'-5' RNA ligase
MITSSEKPIRAFIAANPGEAVRAELLRLQGRLTRELAGTLFKISWLKPEAMHLTFFFLGDIPAARLDVIFRGLEKTARNFPGFGMSLAAAGCFGHPRAPRVLWAGLNAPPELFKLQEHLAGALAIQENKPFHPHLTLGRVRSGRGLEVLQALRKLPVEPVPFEVASLELMQSELVPDGVRHTVLGSAPLTGEKRLSRNYYIK